MMRRFAVCAGILLLVLVAHAECRGDPSGPCDDSKHYGLVADSYRRLHFNKTIPFNQKWAEWWFFTIFDPDADLGVCLSYAVGSHAIPGNHDNVPASVYTMVYKDALSNHPSWTFSSDNYTEGVSASAENASVTVGPQNYIMPLNETTYRMVGKTNSGSLQWDLIFTRTTDPMVEEQSVLDGVMELDWLSYMPSAEVSGKLIVDGKPVPLGPQAQGYHDHNSGYWLEPVFDWKWGSLASHAAGQPFSVVYGAYRIDAFGGLSLGYLFMRYKGQHIKIGSLCGDSFSLTPLEWKTWPGVGKKYASKVRVEASNKQYKLEWEYDAQSVYPNPGGWVLVLEVFEQLSVHTLNLYESDASGNWNLLETIKGFGFTEWSDTQF